MFGRRKKQYPHTLVINGRNYSAIDGSALETTEMPHQQPRRRAAQIDGLQAPSSNQAAQVRPIIAATTKPPTRVYQSETKPVRGLDGPSHPHHSKQTITPKHRRTPLEATHVHHRRSVPVSIVRPDVKPALPVRAIKASTPMHTSSSSARPKTAFRLPGTKEARERAKRAKQIPRSAKISKFTPTVVHPSTKKTTPLPLVRQAPQVPIVNTHHRPPHPAQYQLETDANTNSHSKHSSIIGHRGRLASLTTLSLAVVLVGAYVIYLNAPSMALRVAASRSGVEAEVPGYTAGYRIDGPIVYRPGLVMLQFRSGDDKSYSLTQEASDWDSTALLNHLVAQQSEKYETIQEKGLTIYLYDGSKAAWVNGGVRYILDSSVALGADQVARIAASL